jgi:farnesyl diphosphate synthase
VTQDTEVLGKTAGKDQEQSKPTYVSLMGLQGAQRHAHELHEQALQALSASALPDTQRLRELADLVVRRQY